MQPNPKVLEVIRNRTDARAAVQDADGLRALILAAEQGRELAAAALAKLDADATTPADASSATRAMPTPAVLADLAAEHSEASERPDPEDLRKQRAEARILAEMQRADTSKLYAAVLEQGGIRPSTADLAEEYRAIPPSYRRPDGMAGDQMAEHLSVHMPELGIREERDLLAFFADRRRRAYHKRAA